jgi:long-chain acyl-CoA synthetase
MLYDRWRQVVKDHRSELALVDLVRGEQWTFAGLASREERVSADPICYPRVTGPAFIFSVLHAWREGNVVCPLELDQPRPAFGKLPLGIAHVKTTSATTGASRMILFTAEQLMADARNIVETMGLRADWPSLGVISLAHSYGFSNLVLPLLLHGIPLWLLDSPLPEAVRRAAGRASAWTVPAVPALWRAWFEAGAITPSFRLGISAGAPLPLMLEESVLQRTGLKLHNFYGASECGGIAYDRSDCPRRDHSLVGSPMDNVCLATLPDGCLVVRSAAVGSGYWPVSDSRLSEGVYQSSDLVELRDGLVFLCGRASDRINVAGRKLAPETVEQALLQCAGVEDCLVFGVSSPDPARGDEVVACVVLRAGAERKAVAQHLRQRLSAWQVPKSWWFVESLNINQRGKISRAEWRERYLRQTSIS